LATEHFHTLLAEVYLLAGDREAGLEMLGEHLRGDVTGWWIPEQHRLRAKLLLLAPGFEGEAEAEFRKALAIAHDRGARLFELRAAVSLTELLHSQGRSMEGHELLSSVYEGFTEGFETPDFRRAWALLTEMGR
jgi:predicted ATPase